MPKRETIRRSKIQRPYRTIIIIFSAITILSTASIAYFSFSKTSIVVTVKDEPYTATFTLPIVPASQAAADSQTVLTGIILETTQEITKEFQAQTQKDTVPSKATGIVTIYNKQAKTQPLVAGTRLLSSDGILFRIDERVDVPPGGQIETTATADQPGKSGELAPTRFTLPGLWPGQQDNVYAENSEPMAGGTRTTTVATREEIEQAKRETFEECYNMAIDSMLAELKSHNADYAIRASKKELLSETSSVEPDAATANYAVTTKIHVIGVSYDERLAQTMALEQARSKLSDDTTLVLADDKPYDSEVSQYDIANQTAELHIIVTGTKNVNLSHSMFDRNNLINMDREEVERYFAQYREIESVQVHFSPFWLFRTPSLADHIDIILQ